ncbi:trans-sialidase [Trypanosoma cruzi Dm28c]|uniref:Trans-sialidase n=2 Tax=Trypanosoma cruzi TaxID=5693 RepID=V5B7U8_TRYCR|nr:trans-sialidase [Trypanosoma cruzi Dm28c]PBJ76508.1 trans-sialidase [Trypanosoma cruzi cruzi]PWV01873.1 putative trans-sialidase, Group V [Trypanosoma cruzi]
MLSRVAAVMAPRTHNRRCVTGSSGRRREGRESEPQRPDMSRHHFYFAVLLLVLVMVCCNAGGAAGAAEQSTVSKFEWKDIKDEEGGVTVESLGAPGLLKVGSDVFAVAEAQCKENSESISFTGIASQLLTTQNVNTPVEVLKEVKDTQFLEDGSADPKKKVDVSRPTTVMKGNDIYMLVGKYSQAAIRGAQESGGGDSGLLLVKGEVSEEENDSGKRIKWSDANAVPRASFGKLDSWTELIGGGGSGVKMHDDTLAFPVQGTRKKTTHQGDVQNDEKTVSLILYSSKDTNNWKLSKGMSDGGCSDPSVVEWEKDKKLIMMMTACDGGRRRVYESGDKGESWTEALGTLSRVWGNKQGEGVKGVRSGFITATIGGAEDNRNVMLVTLPVYPEEDSNKETDNGKGKLHLWLTDNTHIVDIGPVSDDDAAASSLLYKSAGSETNKEEEQLIALYEKKEDGKPSPGMVCVPLTAQLQRVKEVLSTWKKADETVSKLCPSESDARDALPDNACSPTVKVTDGLVGFLSGKFSENTWRDEYLGVNATVKGNEVEGKKATLHEGGVTFTGAWAQWPVGSQGVNQLYHFANYNFTLVATVSIDKVPEGITHIPLMGVKMNDNENSVLLGLSYDKEKKCILMCGGGTDKEHDVTLATETTHHVAIVLQNGIQGSAYVNGQRVGGDVPCALGNKDSEAISHFYIGGDGGAKSASEVQDVSVTVRNVLLYNRPLSTAEIGSLNPNKASSPSVVPDNAQGTVPQSSSAGQPPSEQGQQKGSIAAGAGGASTPATSTAAASSGQEPVKQLTSGTSPRENKNADGTPSSDADPTVVTVGGETVRGDGSPQTPEVSVSSGEDGEATGGTDGQEGIHAQHGEVNATALSSLGNVSQGNNTDASTVRGSGLLPSLLLLLGLWVFAAL